MVKRVIAGMPYASMNIADFVLDNTHLTTSQYVGRVYTSKYNGDITLIGGIDYRHVLVYFINTAVYKIVGKTQLKDNCTISDPMRPVCYNIGYQGIGKYIPSGGEYNEARWYRLWHRIHRRCYDPKTWERSPTYEGCTVSERWHNFQNFCEDIQTLEGFYEWNKKGSVYQLDKDIKIQDNKEYSKKACKFVTPRENGAKAVANRTQKDVGYVLNTITGEIHEVSHVGNTAHLLGIGKNTLYRGFKQGVKYYKFWVITKKYPTNTKF